MNKTYEKNKALGKFGETTAKNYLINKGFELISENYFTRKGELDLIFKDNNTLIFIEVKTRKNKMDLSLAIGFKKSQHLYSAAEIFIEKEQIPFEDMRFDIIFVLINTRGEVEEIEHRPNFF
ncbi:MAG: YraN family protein [Brevinemataceae bacterium]